MLNEYEVLFVFGVLVFIFMYIFARSEEECKSLYEILSLLIIVISVMLSWVIVLVVYVF